MSITLAWLNSEYRDWRDVIPAKWFQAVGSVAEATHDVTHPEKPTVDAKCKVTVFETYADLDYEAFKQYNRKKSRDHYIGVLRLHFADGGRRTLRAAEWKAEGKEVFERYIVSASSYDFAGPNREK